MWKTWTTSIFTTGNDETTERPGVVHGHADVRLVLPGRDLHGPDEGGGVAGDGHGARDPPGEDEHRVPGEHSGDEGERELIVYQGTNAVIRPNTIIVTEAPHIAVLRPNLSDTSPEQKDPRAKPGEKSDLLSLYSYL